jgi:hypothetical protein
LGSPLKETPNKLPSTTIPGIVKMLQSGNELGNNNNCHLVNTLLMKKSAGLQSPGAAEGCELAGLTNEAQKTSPNQVLSIIIFDLFLLIRP